jgi:hypothetical protein
MQSTAAPRLIRSANVLALNRAVTRIQAILRACLCSKLQRDVAALLSLQPCCTTHPACGVVRLHLGGCCAEHSCLALVWLFVFVRCSIGDGVWMLPLLFSACRPCVGIFLFSFLIFQSVRYLPFQWFGALALVR